MRLSYNRGLKINHVNSDGFLDGGFSYLFLSLVFFYRSHIAKGKYFSIFIRKLMIKWKSLLLCAFYYFCLISFAQNKNVFIRFLNIFFIFWKKIPPSYFRIDLPKFWDTLIWINICRVSWNFKINFNIKILL